MKKLMIILAVLLLTIPNLLFAQETPEEPTPPEVPDVLPHVQDYEHYFKISEDNEKKLLSELKTELKRHFTELKKYNKEEYFELLRESQYRNMRHPFATKREKEMLQIERRIFELEVATRSLSAKYGSDKSADKNNIKSQLNSTIGELFDLKEQNRKAQVKQLEMELVKLKKELDVRGKNKNEIIRRRVQELLGEDDYLEWD